MRKRIEQAALKYAKDNEDKSLFDPYLRGMFAEANHSDVLVKALEDILNDSKGKYNSSVYAEFRDIARKALAEYNKSI